MQQIVCPKCRAQVDANLNFCPECGSVLPLPNSNGINQGEKLTQVNQQHVAQAILNEGKKKQNPKTALAVGVIAALAIVVVFVVLFVTAGISSDSNKNSTQSNANSSVSSMLESSEPESSVAAVVSEESSEMSVEESSEMSVEESSKSDEESSTPIEESSDESSEASTKTVITVEKPDGWNNIYCYVYTKGNTMVNNGEWPGEELTENDGKYQYELSERFNDNECYVIFSSDNRESGSKAQYPYSGYDGFKLSEKTDYTVADFEAYAEEFKANNG